MKIKPTILAFIVLAIPSALIAQVVDTQFGQVEGTMNGTVYQFLGIPFAKPPVGELRWKFPENPDNWQGILETKDFAPVCPQKKFEQGSDAYTLEGNEDCLYLNVWTPQTGTAGLPVMVFIHGGGNQQGGASSEELGTKMYSGKNMAARGNVVVVTIQYRLGPLGFLVHPGLETENGDHISGNYAVMDQILALTWVKNNISNFGGDPEKVMIFGESAGGVNVGNLLTTPKATGLFQRACIESATPLLNAYEDSKNKGIAFVNGYTDLGDNTQKMAFMRSLPADSIIKNLVDPLAGGLVQLAWQPVVDGVVFPDFPAQSFQKGTFNKVPLITGSNSEEMSLNVPQTVYPAMVTALVNTTVPEALRGQALTLYPPGNEPVQARKSYVGILTDSQFTISTRRTAQCVSLNQTDPVWRYFFTYKHSLPALAAVGSYHGMELFYVFNNWENTLLGSGLLFKPQDDSVQKAMLGYWVNFAKAGNPNSSDLVSWPQYNSATDSFLEIKATPDGSKNGVRTAECDLWDDATAYSGCSSSVGVISTKSSDNLSVYPSPANDILFISGLNEIQNVTIRIYDLNGKEVKRSQNTAYIDISSFPAGMYLLKATGTSQTWQAKFIRK